jgi:hypothetical protein
LLLLPADDLLSVPAPAEDFSLFADFAAPPALADFVALDLSALFAVELFAVEPFAVELLAVFAFDEEALLLPLLAELSADFADEPFSPPLWALSAKLPTASAATLSALTAAPVAAPIKISPATSLAVSRIGEASFFVCFAVGFLSAPLVLAADDFAEVDFFAVDFVGSFFAAINFSSL